MSKDIPTKNFEIPLEAPPSQKLSTRFAHLISNISNPLFVALPTFLVVSLHTAPDLLHALFWWAIPVVGVSIVPFVFILRGVRHGHFSDSHISIREQRLAPLLFGIGCTIVVFLCLLFVHASKELLATLVAVLVGGMVTLGITKFWKISLHLVGIAGAVTVFVLLFGVPFLLLSPLVVLIGWARWEVRAHTLLQALAGSVLASTITIATFWIFQIH